MAVTIPRSRAASRRPLLDRLLGTSRRRRQAAYVALYAGCSLLRPTLRRLGGAAAGLAVLAATALLAAAVT